MESIIKQIAGKVFKDGPYEYRIYIKSGDLGGLGNINSISLFVENTPGHIGVDLIIYAMGHLIDIAGPELKNSKDEFMINKIYMEEYESLGEMITAMGFSGEFGLQPFPQLNSVILRNKDKKIDLEGLNTSISTRANKLKKALDYMAGSYVSPIDGSPTKITYNISGKPTRSNNTLVPGLTINVNMQINNGTNTITDYQTKNTIVSDFKEQLRDISPIQINSYDNFVVNIKV
jgi:hypothetical protein